MRPVWIFFLIVALLVFLGNLTVDYVKKGGLERYLDSHPSSINPSIEYCFGMLLNLADYKDSSLYWFKRVYDKYPDSKSAPAAWAEAIQLLDEKGLKKEAEEESNKFLEKNPQHYKAEIIRRKMLILKNAY